LEDLEDTIDILKAELEGEPTMSFEEHQEKMKAGKKPNLDLELDAYPRFSRAPG
jgi:hypothetical protein